MNYHYTHLGAVPGVAKRSAERRDAMLARTGPAARQILANIKKLPRNQQVAALDRVLADFDPNLPTRVRRVAEHLRGEGMSINEALERAIALSLADASINRIKNLGYAYQQGRVLPMGYLGLGQTSESSTDQERSSKKVVGDMFQGIVCSDGLQTSVTSLVGRNEGAQAQAATNIGYEVAQGFAQCGAQAPPPPVPPATQESEKPSLVGPVLFGMGALVVVGGVVWYTRKK